MTRNPNDKDKFSKEPKPGILTDSQIYRDRLNKKLATQKANQSTTRGNAFQTNVRNRFQNTDSGNASRKARKGYRPG